MWILTLFALDLLFQGYYIQCLKITQKRLICTMLQIKRICYFAHFWRKNSNIWSATQVKFDVIFAMRHENVIETFLQTFKHCGICGCFKLIFFFFSNFSGNLGFPHGSSYGKSLLRKWVGLLYWCGFLVANDSSWKEKNDWF